jgi:hypothetical protein
MPETFADKLIDNMHRKGEYGFYSENEDFNQKVISPWRKITPRYKKFVDRDFYPEEEVKRDVAFTKKVKNDELRRRQESGYAGRTEEAVSSEPVIMEGIGSYDWWGENVTIIPATKFDDIVNGVDMIAAFELDDGRVIHLAIDTTADDSKMTFARKFKKDIDKLEKNELTNIRYYDNPDLDEFGNIKAPRVVLGIDKETVTKMQGRMVEKDRTLAEASIGRTLLKEAEIQLVYALDYLLSKSKISGYKEMATAEELLQFIQENEGEIDENMEDIISKYSGALVVINEQIKNGSPEAESHIDEHLPDIINREHLRQIESKNSNGRPYLPVAV